MIMYMLHNLPADNGRNNGVTLIWPFCDLAAQIASIMNLILAIVPFAYHTSSTPGDYP